MKTIVITGATSRIGFKCGLQLSKIFPEERLKVACCNMEAGNIVIQTIQQKTGHKNLQRMQLDLEY